MRHVPSYVQIEYSQPRDRFEPALAGFDAVLRDLGMKDAAGASWLAQVASAIADRTDRLPAAPRLGCQLAGAVDDSPLTPLILDFRNPSAGWPEGQINFNLMAPSESVYDDEGRFKEWAGTALSGSIRVVHRWCPDVVVFVTDEVTDGVSCDALPVGGVDLWQFDLALVPPLHEARFVEPPSGYERHHDGEVTWYARSWSWPRLPWAG